MDASDEESVKALVAATVKDMGQVDILVNSQGLNKKFPAEDFDMGVFQQMLSVNVAGVMGTQGVCFLVVPAPHRAAVMISFFPIVRLPLSFPLSPQRSGRRQGR